MLHRAAVAFMATLYFAFSGAVSQAASASAPMQLPPQPKVHPAALPAQFVLVSPCIPGMGEHWANMKNSLHASTIYGTYQGKPVFTEIMLLQSDFSNGRNFTDTLKPLPGYKIDHVDIEFLPHGHPGMAYPHYDVHGYYVSHAAHAKFCAGSKPM